MSTVIKTTDIFKACYLYYNFQCELEISKQQDTVLYTIEGEVIQTGETEIMTGEAFIDFCCFKETFLCLLERGGQAIQFI
ncbi:hypothetical protein KKA14_07295 [bacterium]|nr:hypothetical protein [bacterium]